MVSEGIEDGLTAVLADSTRPVAVGISLAGIMNMQLPEAAGGMILMTQAKDRGNKAVQRGIQKIVDAQWQQGKEVRLFKPRAEDANAWLVHGEDPHIVNTVPEDV